MVGSWRRETAMIQLFKHLEIPVDLAGFQGLRNDLVAKVGPPWSCLGDRDFTAAPGGKLVAFGFRNGNYPDADLFLDWHGGLASINVIVPTVLARLSQSQHNALLDDFYDKFVKPAAVQLQLKVNVTAGQRDFAEWIGPEAMRRLEVFSGLAPKTNINHPRDRERWMDFVIAVQKNCGGDPLPAAALQRWLIDDGWPEVFAQELADEYSNVIEWLERYAIAS
jgi:hypothetical protein